LGLVEKLDVETDGPEDEDADDVDRARRAVQYRMTSAQTLGELQRCQQERAEPRNPVRQQPPFEGVVVVPDRMRRIDEKALVVIQNISGHRRDRRKNQILQPKWPSRRRRHHFSRIRHSNAPLGRHFPARDYATLWALARQLTIRHPFLRIENSGPPSRRPIGAWGSPKGVLNAIRTGWAIWLLHRAQTHVLVDRIGHCPGERVRRLRAERRSYDRAVPALRIPDHRRRGSWRLRDLQSRPGPEVRRRGGAGPAQGRKIR